jgi:hypothetical protein
MLRAASVTYPTGIPSASAISRQQDGNVNEAGAASRKCCNAVKNLESNARGPLPHFKGWHFPLRQNLVRGSFKEDAHVGNRRV